MTKVKRYHLTETGLVEGEALGRLSVVLAADFERVTAERDALRNEVGQVKGEYDRAVNKVDALQQRLTAANERADDAVNLLEIWRTWIGCDRESCDETGKKIWDRIDAVTALKQSEGGGDEHRS